MQHQDILRTDVAIVGGGLAGSMAATMLGRAERQVVLIDPNDRYPVDFRCEKIEQGHVRVLGLAGLAPAITREGTHTDGLWVARYGRLVDKAPFDQYGMAYDQLVNTMRAQVPAWVTQCRARVDAIETTADRQRLRLTDGREVDARLVILASGLNWGLREALGLRRTLVSPCHSISVGFDLRRADGSDFAFPALQYNPEAVGKGIAYLTLFRIGGSMRANLFLHVPLRSRAVQAFRDDPDAALFALLPGLAPIIGAYSIAGRVRIRPIDLHVTEGYEQPGVVFVGDAFEQPCPATGTGTLKVFTDVERLCGHHIPAWLATAGMGVDKIGAFYADPVKRACDAMSVEKAYRLRSLSLETTLRWELQRRLRFVSRLGKWALRSMRGSLRKRRDSAWAAEPIASALSGIESQASHGS